MAVGRIYAVTVEVYNGEHQVTVWRQFPWGKVYKEYPPTLKLNGRRLVLRSGLRRGRQLQDMLMEANNDGTN